MNSSHKSKKIINHFNLNTYFRLFVISASLIIIGVSLLIFTKAATPGMGSDCKSPGNETVNRQQLWCETHASHEPATSGSYIFPHAPSVHGQRSSSYLTYFTPVNGGATTPPENGLIGTPFSISGGQPNSDVESVHTWIELTSDNTNYVNSDVELKTGSLNLAFHMKSSNVWLVGNGPDGPRMNCQNTGFGYSGDSSLQHDTGPSGGALLGWNVGGKFMNLISDTSGSNGRMRHHCGEWNQQPNANYGDVDAVVAWGTFRTVGPAASSSTYRLEIGVDRRLYSSPGDIASYPGRLRRVTPDWQTFTVSTMSDTLLNKPGYADALVGIIPGYTLDSTTPTPVPGDTDEVGSSGYGIVNLTDLNKVLLNWGKTGQTRTNGNFTSPDTVINLADLNIVLLNWSR